MELVNLSGSLLLFDDREIPRTERQRVALRDVASIQQIRTSAVWITRLHLCTRVVEVIVHALAHTVHAMGYVYRGRFRLIGPAEPSLLESVFQHRRLQRV